MHLEKILEKKFGREKLEEKIKEKFEALHNLLTREAAIRLIAKENGIEIEKEISFSELKEGNNRDYVICKIEKMLDLQTFSNGKKMRKVVLNENNNKIELKFWNEDIKILNNLSIGDIVKIKGIYKNGNDYSLSYNGEIKVIKRANFVKLGDINLFNEKTVNVEAFVEEIDGFKEYSRNGKKRIMFSFFLRDNTGFVRAIIWNKSERGKLIEEGKVLRIENAFVKNGELYLGRESRILLRRKKEEIRGKVEDLKLEDNNLILKINNDEVKLSREDLNKIIGQVEEDITLSTIFTLIKNKFLGKEIFIEKEGEKIKNILFFKKVS